MAATDKQQIRQTKELMKATDELIEAQKELAELEKKAVKAEADGQKEELKLLRKKQDALIKESEAIESRVSAEQSRQEKIEKAGEASTTETEQNQARTSGAVGRSIAAMEKQSESFLASIPFLKDFGESLGDPGKKNLLIFTAGMAAGVVEMTRLTKNLLDLNSIAPLAFGSFSEGLIGTSELMFDTGLAAGELKAVFKEFPGTFRRFKTQIGDAADANEDLVLSLGLTREEFTKQTVQALALANAQGKGAMSQERLNEFSRKYVVELNTLAIQTGRSADEIEEQRAQAIQSTKAFLITLPADLRGGMIAGIKTATDELPQISDAILGIIQTIDPGEATDKANSLAIGLGELLGKVDGMGPVTERFGDVLRGVAARNEEAIEDFPQAIADFAKEANARGIELGSITAGLAQVLGADLIASIGGFDEQISKSADANKQSRFDRIKNAQATKRQTEIVEDATEKAGFWAEAVFDGSKLLSVFGADLTNIGIFLFGLSKTLTAIGPALTLFKNAVVIGTAPFIAAFALLTFAVLAVASRWDRIVEGLITIGNDLNENFIQPFLEFIEPHISAIVLMFQDFRDFIEPWVPAIKMVFDTFLDIVTFLPRKIFGFIEDIIPDGLKSFFELLIINIKELLPDIGSFLGGDDPDSFFSKAKGFFGGGDDENVITATGTSVPDSVSATAATAAGRTPAAPATAAVSKPLAVVAGPELTETEIDVAGSTEKQILGQMLETLKEMNRNQFVAVQLADKTTVNTERVARNTALGVVPRGTRN